MGSARLYQKLPKKIEKPFAYILVNVNYSIKTHQHCEDTKSCMIIISSDKIENVNDNVNYVYHNEFLFMKKQYLITANNEEMLMKCVLQKDLMTINEQKKLKIC